MSTHFHDHAMDVAVSPDGRETVIDARNDQTPEPVAFRIRVRYLEDVEIGAGLGMTLRSLYEWSVCRLEPVGEEFARPGDEPMDLETDMHRGIGVGFDSALRSARLVAAVRGWSGRPHDWILKLIRSEASEAGEGRPVVNLGGGSSGEQNPS